jgi:hypothetical protein
MLHLQILNINPMNSFYIKVHNPYDCVYMQKLLYRLFLFCINLYFIHMLLEIQQSASLFYYTWNPVI